MLREAPINRYSKNNRANERGNVAFREHGLPESEKRHGQSGAGRDVLIFFPSANVDFQCYPPTVMVRRPGAQRVAPESQRRVPSTLVEEKLRAVDRRMTFVDHDTSQAREVAEAAESLAEEAFYAIAGFAQRLERLERSDAALRRDNAEVRGLHHLDPPRPPRYRNPRYAHSSD